MEPGPHFSRLPHHEAPSAPPAPWADHRRTLQELRGRTPLPTVRCGSPIAWPSPRC